MAQIKESIQYSPGMRLIIRDEEWIVRRVETSTSGLAIVATGASSLTRGQERVFLTDLESKIEILDPKKTQFVTDRSPQFRNSRLFIESQLRQTPPTDAKIYVGHKAAIDPLNYQFTPAVRALQASRPRVLIADAVGLGKTIECGILLSELIKRGRGKRILVLTVKSMTTQFQKELWARFSIPLTRLDSVGIQRVRNRIPANSNPFYYYDKAIVSIDTLKRAGEYRNYLEQCHWDVIAIDEAHNVAERNKSQRSQLAKLVATHCDALIMLSATPHDGSRRSFASLIDMLDPTAIVNPDTYKPEEVQGLFTRRFKTDVKDEVQKAFPERRVENRAAKASPEEEEAFDLLASLQFKYIDSTRKRSEKGNFLFRTTLEKALFSSPDACRETIKRRLATLNKILDRQQNDENDLDAQEIAQARKTLDAQKRDDALGDVQALQRLDKALAKIGPREFSRYQLLLSMLRPGCGDLFGSGGASIGWDGKEERDRVVIFTERVQTVKFLEANLKKDLKLPKDAIVTMDAAQGDVAVNEAVAKFGQATSPVRIMICTDIASEGVNLHYCSHRLIHFDTPWALITFQQRNGRIDRYGQEARPEIYYLSIESDNKKIQGDQHILELLKAKDEQVVDSIGDPSEFTNCLTAEAEDAHIAGAIEENKGEDPAFELDEAFYGIFEDAFETPETTDEDAPKDAKIAELHTAETKKILPFQEGRFPSLYRQDADYLIDALDFINSAGGKKASRGSQGLEYSIEKETGSKRTIRVTPNDSFKARLKYMAQEILPDAGHFYLCDDKERVQREYKKALSDERQWPEIQYLWNEHPLVQYLNETVLTAFGRLRAPLMFVDGSKLQPNETLFLLSGLVPNKQSQPVVSRRLGVLIRDGRLAEHDDLETWIERLKLDEELLNVKSCSNPNDQTFEDVDKTTQERLTKELAAAVGKICAVLQEASQETRSELLALKEERKRKLDEWRKRKVQYFETLFDVSEFRGEKRTKKEQQEENARLEVERVFRDHQEWFDNAATIDPDRPSIVVLAAIRGEK